MPQADRTWIDLWIDAVADGSASMSQRRLSSIERNGGVAAAVSAAEARGVHLAKLTGKRRGRLRTAMAVEP